MKVQNNIQNLDFDRGIGFSGDLIEKALAARTPLLEHAPLQAAVNEKNKSESPKKKGSPWIQAANIAGVTAWLGIVGTSLYLAWRGRYKVPDIPKGFKATEAGLKKLEAATGDLSAELADIQAVIKDPKKAAEMTQINANGLGKIKKPWGYKFGLNLDKLQSQSKELFNNIVYCFGSLCVVPLVVIFAPWGKDASVRDRVTTVLRQPLSVVSMLSLQIISDKLCRKFSSGLINKNHLEANDIQAALKAKNTDGIFNKVRYNSKPLKDVFTGAMTKQNLTQEAADILKHKSFESAEKRLIEIANQKGISGSVLEGLNSRLKHYHMANKRAELLKTAVTILVNVFLVVPISTLFLNVLYGKTVQKINEKIDAKKPKAEGKKDENK